MNRNVYLWIVLLYLAFSCNVNKEEEEKNDSANFEKIYVAYQQYKSFFDSSFIDHFPQKINGKQVTLIVDTNALSDHPRLMVYTKIMELSLDTLLERVVASYQADDSCLLVVNRFTVRENWHLRSKHNYVDKSLISKECYKDKYPIPNFWDSDYVTLDTETRLPKDFTIYVLEAKSGEFWDENHRTNGRYMPEEWKNGYSKGVAISEKRNTIIYWFIIW